MDSEEQVERSYETNSQRERRIKLENLWILQWICRIALAFSLLIFLDLILPPQEETEKIIDSWSTYGGRHSSRSIKIQIETGQKFSIHPDQFTAFRELNRDGTIVVNISQIFGMVLFVYNREHTISIPISLMHSYLVFIPLLMFVVSLAGVIANNRVDLVYNFGAVSLILIVINIYMIIFVTK